MGRVAGKIYTEIHGDGRDVVLIHGWGMHSGVWRDFSKSLAERFRVTAIDLPGHGRSGMIADFDLDGIARALLAVAPRRAHWLGWSLGAEISLYAASHHPERVASLTMLAGNARFARGEDWPCAMDASLLNQFGSELVQDYHATLMKFMGLQTFGLDNARTVLKELRDRVAECEDPDAEALRAGLEILRRADLRQALSALQVPLLLLMGARDRLAPPAAGQAMRGLAGDAELHVLEGAAHVPFLTHERACVSLLTEFWTRHAATVGG